MDDEQILALFQARDELALSTVQEKYGNRLKRVARRVLISEDDAEEICNETYLRAWNAIPPACPKSLSAYLTVICRNLAINQLEKKKARKRNVVLTELTKELEEALPGPPIDEILDERELGRSS